MTILRPFALFVVLALGTCQPASGVGLARGAAMQGPGPWACPYDFQQATPPGVFCAYLGVAESADGEICAEDVLAIWSAPEPAPDGGEAGAAGRAVYIGIADRATTVLRARARTAHLAELIELLPGADGAAPAATGVATLGRAAVTQRRRQTLSLRLLRELPPQAEAEAACGLATYVGVFVDVVQRGAADDQTASIE